MFAAGQRWTYRAPAGFEASRIVIGAVVQFGAHESVVCVAVAGAARQQSDGTAQPANIAFLPFSSTAFAQTVLSLELEAWAGDKRGMTLFTVPLDGTVDKLLARQMAEIVQSREPLA
jgi:hypothetical protein